jgi:cytochrome P450
MTVICEMLGIPPAPHDPPRCTTATMMAGLFGDPGDYLAAVLAHAELIRKLVADKRRRPADDVLSALVAARDGTDRLTAAELTSTLSLLVIAGHETTADLIGNGVHLLLTHPDQLVLFP